MPKIDIGAVLRQKAPRLARWIPRPVVNWLRRTIHESEINHILEHYWSLPPQEFIRACFREWQVTYSIEGLDKLAPGGRYLFASNHPFGGMDGMMLADKLIDRFGDARVVVNDLLMYLEPLRPLWIPVNKHGAQSASYARKFDEEFFGDLPVLTFPAGLCSRPNGGEVTDPEWKISFLKRPTPRSGRSFRSSSKGVCRSSSTASTESARRWASSLTSRCCGCPTKCFRRRAAISASSSATRFPWPNSSVSGRCTNRHWKYVKKRIFWKKRSPARIKTANFGIFALSCNRKRIQYPSSNRSPGNCCSQN